MFCLHNMISNCYIQILKNKHVILSEQLSKLKHLIFNFNFKFKFSCTLGELLQRYGIKRSNLLQIDDIFNWIEIIYDIWPAKFESKKLSWYHFINWKKFFTLEFLAPYKQVSEMVKVSLSQPETIVTNPTKIPKYSRS